ncbi:MAG: TonB-dependent receptor [Spongiibacteraceae bacterium]
MKKAVYQRVALARPATVLGALASAISACYAPQVFAAEARQMDEIIVTARRKDEMAQEVPISMTVMTEDFLRNNNVAKIEDIGTKVPSLRITSVGTSRNEPVITLRGQRQGEAAFNQDPAAPLYFNEIVMAPIQGGNAGLYDLESLQVLKGPQGTLFGRNSTGGAVMITPKRPGYKLGGYAEVKVGNYDLFGFEGAVDVPLFDTVTTRLAVQKTDRDGYQKNIANNALYGRRYNDEHTEGARLSVNFEQGALSNLTVVSYDHADEAAGVPVPGGYNSSAGVTASSAALRAAFQEQMDSNDPWKVKSDIDGREIVRNTFLSNTTEYEIADELSVKNVFGYRKVHFGTATDADGTYLPIFGAIPYGGISGTLNPDLNKIDTEFYSDEFQLFGTALNTDLDWITGLYWSKLDGDERKRNRQPGSYEIAHNSIENTSIGLFVEGTYAFTDEWAVTAGARQSLEKREMTVSKFNDLAMTNCVILAEGSTTAAPGCQRTVDEDFDSTTWKVSVNYTPTTTMLIYGSVSTGFRAGGFNTRGTNDATLVPYDPENVTTFELGTKQDWELADMPVRSNLAVYLQKYEDIQQTRAAPSITNPGTLDTATINAAKAEITGAELDVSIKPTDDLTLSVSYSYVDAKYKSKTDVVALNQAAPTTLTELDTSDDDFTYIPQQSATASITYMLPLDASLGDISVMASAYWQTEMATHPLLKEFDSYAWSATGKQQAKDASTVDGYTIYNLRVDWRGIMGSTFDAALYCNNVSDEEYVQGGLNIVDSFGIASYNYGAPRTYGASVKYSF